MGGAESMWTGPVYPSWNRLRNELQRLLVRSAENLYATADALVRAADLYEATDTDAGKFIQDDKKSDELDPRYHIPELEHRKPLPPVP